MVLFGFISTLITVTNIYKIYDENRQACFLLDQSPTQTELLLIYAIALLCIQLQVLTQNVSAYQHLLQSLFSKSVQIIFLSFVLATWALFQAVLLHLGNVYLSSSVCVTFLRHSISIKIAFCGSFKSWFLNSFLLEHSSCCFVLLTCYYLIGCYKNK